jgi:hypothetical protein
VLKVDEERVLLFIMAQMEQLRCKPFVIVYAYSNASEDNLPQLDFVQAIFDLFSCR